MMQRARRRAAGVDDRSSRSSGVRTPGRGRRPGVLASPNEASVAARDWEEIARRALVFEHMSDAVVVTDLDGRIVDWNRAATRIFGYAKEEMLGRSARHLYRLEAPREVEAEVIETMRRLGGWSGELTFVRGDGSEGVCETTVVPLCDERGERIATVGVNRDLSERKRVEAALAQSHGILRAVFEGIGDAVFVKDLKGRYVMINGAGARQLGRSPEEVVGRDDAELFPREEALQIREIDRKVVESGTSHTFEEIVTFGQRTVRLSTTKAPWRTADGRLVGLIGIARDVTELRRSEEERQQHQAHLAHVLRVHTVGEMASGLAHEINQPLGAIANYAQGCACRLRAGEGASEEILSAIEQIAAQAWRAGDVVRRLGEFVRKQPCRREVTDLNEIIEAAVQLVEPEAKRDRVAVETHRGVLKPVLADPVLIEQVILNLLRNAVEAMREAGAKKRSLRIHSRSEGDGVRVDVCDSGPGLPDPPERLFDPFYTTKPEGLGMGLAISRSIAEAHAGRLWATAQRPRGACFHLWLPTG